jgi:hypothetical protein
VSDRIRFGLALLAAWGLVLAAIAATALLVGADLSAEEREPLVQILQDRAPHVILISLLLLVPLVFILQVLFRRYIAAPRKLSEDVRIMLTANPAHRAPLRGSAELQRLAADLNSVAAAREDLQHDVEKRVREANARIEEEKNRLAALMSELAQSVLMCNVEGRIALQRVRCSCCASRSMALQAWARPTASSDWGARSSRSSIATSSFTRWRALRTGSARERATRWRISSRRHRRANWYGCRWRRSRDRQRIPRKQEPAVPSRASCWSSTTSPGGSNPEIAATCCCRR